MKSKRSIMLVSWLTVALVAVMPLQVARAQTCEEVVQDAFWQGFQEAMLTILADQIDQTDTDNGEEDTQITITLGGDTLDYVRENSPGKFVDAARQGQPTFGPDELMLPEDEPDFVDRVRNVFLNALYEAILNTIGNTSDSTSSE